MKSLVWILCSGLGFWGCYATESGASREPVLESETAYDDNRPSEELTFITTSIEQMVRFAPQASSYRLLRLRVQLASPGRLHWAVYEQDSLEQPGTVLASWDRDYSPAWASGPTDGKWVVEDLTSRIPGSRGGAIWIGVRRAGPMGKIWSADVPSGQAFMRDTDPGHFLRPMPVRRTPMIRLDWKAE